MTAESAGFNPLVVLLIVPFRVVTTLMFRAVYNVQVMKFIIYFRLFPRRLIAA